MSTFEELRRLTRDLARRVSEYSGVPQPLVLNIINYARCLPRPSTPGLIDELIFIAQMGRHFEITSLVHARLIYAAVRLKEKNAVSVDDYVRLICIFISNKLDIQIDYVFSVYDFNHDNKLDRFEITTLLRPSIISSGDDNDPEEAAKELVDLVMSVFDTNMDGSITLDEFRDHVSSNVLYIQLLGQVLPKVESLQRFLMRLKHKSAYEVRAKFANERAEALADTISSRETLLTSLYPVDLDMP